MPEPGSDPIGDLLVEHFNLDLAELSSSARVALPKDQAHQHMLELQDDEGNFLCFIPADTAPEMAAIAYRLHGQAFNRGVRAGEEAAWAKLRHLIGAVSVADLKNGGDHG